jgi:cytochrome b561
MRAFFIAGVSGWLGTILIAMVALLPYMLRRSPLGVRLGVVLPSNQPYLRRMWPHFWLAYAATALSFVHAWALMSRRAMARDNPSGLYLATLALSLLFLQIMLGLTLQQRRLPGRKAVRNWHFWTMAGVVILVGAHIWLNG